LRFPAEGVGTADKADFVLTNALARHRDSENGGDEQDRDDQSHRIEKAGRRSLSPDSYFLVFHAPMIPPSAFTGE
jgi:hypothetical protein